MNKVILKNITNQSGIEKNPEKDLQTFTIRVNPKLIKSAIDQRFTNELAFYYLLKFHYKFSRISNKNSPKSRISQLSGLSIPTINKYFDRLHYLGLIRVDRNGWELMSFQTKVRYKITVNENPTVSQIKNLMLFIILRQEGTHQALISSLKEFIQDRKQDQELSGYKELNSSFEPYLSVRYISTQLRISKTSASNLIHDLNFSGAIKTIFDGSEFVTTCRPGSEKYLFGTFGHKYCQSAGLYKVQPARHDFLMNPIKVRPMTLKRYKIATRDPKVRKFVDELNLTLIN